MLFIGCGMHFLLLSLVYPNNTAPANFLPCCLSSSFARLNLSFFIIISDSANDVNIPSIRLIIGVTLPSMSISSMNDGFITIHLILCSSKKSRMLYITSARRAIRVSSQQMTVSMSLLEHIVSFSLWIPCRVSIPSLVALS